MSEKADACDPCVNAGRKGYCALGRCYCGHSSCPAFGSWSPLPDLRGADTPTPAVRRSTTWDDREESTWIDKL